MSKLKNIRRIANRLEQTGMDAQTAYTEAVKNYKQYEAVYHGWSPWQRVAFWSLVLALIVIFAAGVQAVF